MVRLRVSATKSNLLRLKGELDFAREGKELLTQKREVLVMELLRLQDDARKAREELEELLAKAYRAFADAALADGIDNLRRLAPAVSEIPELRIEERTVMGVPVPLVKVEESGKRPEFGPAGISTDAFLAVDLFLELRRKLLEVAEIETAIYRLATETSKTLRRERALENMFIPQYAETVKFIQELLEEKDREAFYHLKLLKKKHKGQGK